MALVAYSDSETSDTEDAPTAPITKPTPASSKPKLLNRTQGNKIKIELPALKAEPGQNSSEPAPKRARTAGAFSGFNSLLPAPKKSGQNAPKKGVSLKTSSEAAFSRVPVPRLAESEDVAGNDTGSEALPAPGFGDSKRLEASDAPKITGKTTRFMPLSVANAKKKKKATPATKATPLASEQKPIPREPAVPTPEEAPSPALAKPKVSLFSLSNEEETAFSPQVTGFYTPEFGTEPSTPAANAPPPSNEPLPTTNANTLSDIASDMNLTAAQRRQLFGRHGANSAFVAHFNMDAEYRSNAELAASGEAAQHKAVKAIAPGKHSLQQLVNNVKSQGDALEDKWAEGRRARGEGGTSSPINLHLQPLNKIDLEPLSNKARLRTPRQPGLEKVFGSNADPIPTTRFHP